MADIQTYFEKFHDAIKLDDENEVLREKRDILLEKLKVRLSQDLDKPPVIKHFSKGSYAMDLGVVPLDGDYDIDVGLEFEIDKEDYPNPVVVKEWVYNALYGHTDDVKIKRPCVTVQYHLDDEPIYHVDFAVYAHDQYTDNIIYLARGKPASPPEEKIWKIDDPKGLIKVIREKFSDEDDRLQFRHVIRYLKRWKNLKFSPNGHEAPTGIGLTVSAYHWFSPSKVLVDLLSQKYRYNDLDALLNLVNNMLVRFVPIIHDGESANRLVVELPVQPYNDLFEKMTNSQMDSFKERMERLRDVLQEALKEADPVEACKMLQKQFGDDFPVPEMKETGQRRGPAIVSPSSAA